MPLAAWLVLAASAGALAFAFCAEYAFDVKACELCYWQRVPFGVTLLTASAALLAWPQERKSRTLIAFSSLVFLVSAGLAFFHTGVEMHWWEDAVSCALPSIKASNISEMSVEEIRDQLLATANPVPCDEVTWSFLGLSLANWNVLASLALAVFSGLAASGRISPDGGATCRFCCFCGKDGSGKEG